MVDLLGVLFATLAACCLAGQAIGVRLATRRGRSADTVLIVLFMNAVTFVALALVFVSDFVLTPTAIIAFVTAGIVSTMLGRVCLFGSIKRIGASRAEPIKASMPLYSTVLAALFLDEYVGTIQFGAILLIVVGVALVSWEGASTVRLADGGVPWTGLLLALGSAVLLGLEPIFATVGFREGTPVLQGLAIKTTGAFVVFFLYMAWRDSLPRPADIPVADRRWYLFAGVTSTAFMLFYYLGLNVSRVGIVVPIMQTSPLIVAAVSATFLGRIERITPRLVAASAIIVVGAIAVTLFG
ncbi:MAG: EamA family transporter [Halobacteriota archaeon]